MSQYPYGNQHSGYYPPPPQQAPPFSSGGYPAPPPQQGGSYGGYPSQPQPYNNTSYPPPPQQGSNYNNNYPPQPQYPPQPAYGNTSYPPPPPSYSSYPPPPGPAPGVPGSNYPGNNNSYHTPTGPPTGSHEHYPPPTQNVGGFPMAPPYSGNIAQPPSQYPSNSPYGPPGPAYGQPAPNSTNYSRPPHQSAPPGGPMHQGTHYGGNPYGGPAPGVSYTAQQANQDAQALRSAMKGFGTDEKAIIQIVSQRTPEQIATLSQAYKANYGKSLADAFRSETSGDFGYLLQGFAYPQIEFETKCIHESIAGLGTDEDALIELLVGRTNSEMHSLKQCYRYMYNRDMEREIVSDTSRDFKRLLVALLQGGRDESQQIYDTSADVEALYRAGEKRLGTDEAVFISVICTRSNVHLIQVFNQYQAKYGKPIQKVIKSEFSGDIERGLLSVVGYIQNQYEWAADQFENSMRGLGTRERKLSRMTLRYRHPSRMPHVKQAYQRKYGKSLYKRVHGETSGDYRALLLACIGQ